MNRSNTGPKGNYEQRKGGFQIGPNWTSGNERLIHLN